MSLIEVMAVTVLLGMGLTTVFSAMGASNSTRIRTDKRNRALAAIQSQVEIFQALDMNALDQQFASSDSIPFAVAGLEPERNPAGGPGLREAGAVTRVSRISGASVRTCLRFRVAWEDASGPDHIELHFHHVPRS